MFTSTLGRGRFFAYSAALLIAEGIAAILCIMGTMGIKGLAESRPGPSREPLALAILIVSGVLLYRLFSVLCAAAGRHFPCLRFQWRR